MMRFAVVIEKADGNYSAYVPDLPGCVATGATVAASKRKSGRPSNFTLRGFRADGLEIPVPTSVVEYVET